MGSWQPKNPNQRLKNRASLCKLADLLLRSSAHVFTSGGAQPTERIVESKKQELLSALKEAGIEVEDASPKLAQCYPPFAPRFICLQVLLLPIKD